jgi:hypothetical protein
MKQPFADVWQRLIAIARATRFERQIDPSSEAAPFGFVTRVLAQVREAREAERRLALWQRIAWRSAFASMLLCGLVFLGQRSNTAGESLIVPPAIDWTTP